MDYYVIECNQLVQRSGHPEADESLRLVEEFHRGFGQTHGACPRVPVDKEAVQRLSLIQEETSELARAIAGQDLVEILDALCDLRYVIDGTAHAFGLQGVFTAAFREVHRSNMTKLGPDGKAVEGPTGRIRKPSHYQPPDLGMVLKGERMDCPGCGQEGLFSPTSSAEEGGPWVWRSPNGRWECTECGVPF